MAPRNRLDRLIWIRERREESALVQLASAERRLVDARAELGRRTASAASDDRASGDAALWALDDAAHRRALQALTVAAQQVSDAAARRDLARAGFTAAHQQTEVAVRIAARKRAEVTAERERRDRRDADEVAVLRHARAARASG